MTDNHLVTSETSQTLVDCMKRYQDASVGSVGINGLPPIYSPTQFSLGWNLRNMFLFHRGGVSYKLFASGASPITPPLTATYYNPDPRTVGPSLFAGQPGLQSSTNPSYEFNISLPWYDTQPYRALGPAGLPLANVTVPLPTGFSYNNVPYTCVRDDYQMGFLIPPPWAVNGGPPAPKQKPKHRQPPPQPISNQPILSDFEIIRSASLSSHP